jgi:hypothetical protein
MAPVLAGMVRYESLRDGGVGVLDLALMNDALAVQAENRRRASKK